LFSCFIRICENCFKYVALYLVIFTYLQWGDMKLVNFNENFNSIYNFYVAAHSLFGATPPGGFGNHLAHLPGAYSMLGRPPSSAQNSAYGMPPSSSASAYGGLGTLSAAANQAASLGINPASEYQPFTSY